MVHDQALSLSLALPVVHPWAASIGTLYQGFVETIRLALDSLGCIVTQATISRDIRELDLQKVRTHLGRAKYVLSSRERPKDPEQAAGHVLRDFARSTAVAQNLVVVRCEIGTASTVARQIDNLNHSDVVGTLAGDDTFVVILKDSGRAAEMQRYVDRLREA